MKKTVSWNGLIAMGVILAMSVCVFGCTDQATTTVESGQGSTGIKGSISGLVVDINNNPVEGAKVTLRYPGVTNTKRTNSAGTYVFGGVPVSGQLGCYEDCDENPYLIVVESPVLRVDGEDVIPYGTEYTAALLSFTSLQAIGAGNYDSVTGTWQAVGNMQVQAITAVMRRPNATVNGFVVEQATGLPVNGALVTLNPDSSSSPPNPIDIWDDGDGSSVPAIGDPTTTTDATGLFSFTRVPEGSDSKKITYTVTVSAPGFALCDDEDYPDVSVGTGNHTYWVDTESGNLNKADAVALCPGLLPTDDVDPWVIDTNVPPSVISAAQLDATFCWRFNEPMNLDLGDATIRQQGAGPIALDTILSGWNIDLALFDPPLTDDACVPTATTPVYYATPGDPLPQGRSFEFELRRMEDLAANQYTGNRPDDSSDAFGGEQDGDIVAKVLSTTGDPSLMCVAGLNQVAAAADPTEPIGGLSANVPQANNLNLLFCNGAIEIGDQNEEANWISLSWTAAAPCVEGEDGVVSSYNVYAENTGLGFAAGIPLLVGSTSGGFLGPDTSWEGFIEDNDPGIGVAPNDTVNTAIAAYNAGAPAVPVPLVDPPNYFDDGFQLPMAVTAVNNDMREGPYSPIVQVRDVVPPTVADQGEGFDETVPTNWAILTVDEEDVDLAGLGTIDAELTPDDVYDAASYTAWLAVQRDLDIGINEDLLDPQPLGFGAELVALGGGGETVASTSVTQFEGGPGCDLAQVTVVMNNLALVQQNDHIGITVMDETGLNVSNAGTVVGGLLNGDSVVHLYDGVPALIETGVAAYNPLAVAEESMTLTFAELVDPTQAVDLANYTLNGGAFPGDATAALEVDGVTVTITAPTGLGVSTGEYVVVADVQDLILNPVSGLGFMALNQVAVANDGVIKPPEVCDPTDLDGEDCVTQGFDEGALACSEDNLSFDTTGCITWECGNGIVEGTEECDNGEANSDTEADACRTNCLSAYCGDGVVDTGEQCDDGNDVAGDGCENDCTLTP